MITICPQCQLSLAVAASDLRIAHGQVRCGRCASVFNALISLYETESEAVVPESEVLPAPAEPPAELPSELAIEISAEPEATADSNDADGLVADLPAEIAANDAQVDVPAAANDPRIDDIAAANDPVASAPQDSAPQDSPPQDSDWQVVPQLEPALNPLEPGTTWLPVYDLSDDQPEPGMSISIEPVTTPPVTTPPAATAAVDIDVGEAFSTLPSEARSEVVEQDRSDLDPLEHEPPQDRRGWAMAAGAGVLALTLAAQLVHFNRDALATWPAVSTPLSQFYASIGRPIALRGDLRAYDVRQLGAFAAPDAAGTLTVRASLRNLAPRAQPMPLLRVTLQDRYGNRIASRDLSAAEYQQRAAGAAPWPLISSGSRLDTAVQLVDPGGKAVGFELDVCLAESRGVVRCANDEPARAAR